MKKAIFFLLTISFFACQNSGDQKQMADETDKMSEKAMMPEAALNDLFEEVNVVKMHLFATSEAEPNPDDYPYIGKAIPETLYGQLDEKFNTASGPVFACYRTENSGHYILRVPGKYVSGDLALAKWDADTGKLMKVGHLAYRWCDEGVCNQQDAWLSDIDDDRDLELIVREHTRDEQGNITNEKFTVSTDNGNGDFETATQKLASLAVKDRYVMQ